MKHATKKPRRRKKEKKLTEEKKINTKKIVNKKYTRIKNPNINLKKERIMNSIKKKRGNFSVVERREIKR